MGKKKRNLKNIRLRTMISDCYNDPLVAAETGFIILEGLYYNGFRNLEQLTKFFSGGKQWLVDQKRLQRQARRKRR